MVWLCVMEGGSVVVADGPGWKVVAVWGLRMMAILPLPITAIYVVKSQLAYGVVDVSAVACWHEEERRLTENRLILNCVMLLL